MERVPYIVRNNLWAILPRAYTEKDLSDVPLGTLHKDNRKAWEEFRRQRVVGGRGEPDATQYIACPVMVTVEIPP